MSDYNSQVPVRTENNGDVAVKVVDSTTPSQGMSVDAAGRISAKLDDGSGNAVTSQTSGATQRALDVGINVAGVQIDPRQIRALTVTDVVSATQGTAAAIAGAWPVKPTDGTNSQGYTAAGEAKVSVTQPLPAGTNIIGSVKLDDGTGNPITSTSINTKQTLDANLPSSGVNGSAVPFGINLIAGSDGTNARSISTDATGKVKVDLNDAAGNAFSATNPLFVSVTSGVPGTEVHDFNTNATLAAGATSNHDYTITASKAFKAEKFWGSASGKLKIEVQVSTNGTTFVTKFVGFNSTATPNIDIFLGQFTLSDSGTGAKIRIIRTNLDKQSMDVYSTISGVEV